MPPSILFTSAMIVSSRRIFFRFPSLIHFFFHLLIPYFSDEFLIGRNRFFPYVRIKFMSFYQNAISFLGMLPSLFSRVLVFRHSVLVSESPRPSNKFRLPTMLQPFSHRVDLVRVAYLTVV